MDSTDEQREQGAQGPTNNPLDTTYNLSSALITTTSQKPAKDSTTLAQKPTVIPCTADSDMEMLWLSRDSIGSPDNKTRAERFQMEITRHVDTIITHLKQNKSVTKGNKENIIRATDAINAATVRFTSELQVLGSGHVTGGITQHASESSPSTAETQNRIDTKKLTDDIVASVQSEMAKLRAEQQAMNEMIRGALCDGQDGSGNERQKGEGFIPVQNRKNNRRAQHGAASAAAAAGADHADDLSSPAAGRPYIDKPNRTITSTNMTRQLLPKTKFVIVAETKDPRDDSKFVIRELKEKVDVAKIGIGINSIRETRKNKVVISCDSDRDRQRLGTVIREKTDLTVGLPVLRSPQIRIIGVIPEFANEGIVDAIRKQNTRLIEGAGNDNRIRFVRALKGRNDSIRNVIIEVSPQVWTVMQGQKIRIGYQSVLAVDQSPILQCFNCFGFGHRAAVCKASVRCAYCAEGHDTRSCTGSGESSLSLPCCVNCRDFGRAEHDHYAFNQACPEWIKWDRIARESVIYC